LSVGFFLDNPALDFPLFAPPREPVALTDYAAGLHAATIVPDGGTLQIGIGSLGDAVVQSLVLQARRRTPITVPALASAGIDKNPGRLTWAGDAPPHRHRHRERG